MTEFSFLNLKAALPLGKKSKPKKQKVVAYLVHGVSPEHTWPDLTGPQIREIQIFQREKQQNCLKEDA